MALDYEHQTLSGTNWETTAVASGNFRAISKILIMNGATAGTLLIELYDAGNAVYVPLAEFNIPAYPIDYYDYIQWYDVCFLKENDKLRFTPSGSSNITVTIFYSEK